MYIDERFIIFCETTDKIDPVFLPNPHHAGNDGMLKEFVNDYIESRCHALGPLLEHAFVSDLPIGDTILEIGNQEFLTEFVDSVVEIMSRLNEHGFSNTITACCIKQNIGAVCRFPDAPQKKKKPELIFISVLSFKPAVADELVQTHPGLHNLWQQETNLFRGRDQARGWLASRCRVPALSHNRSLDRSKLGHLKKRCSPFFFEAIFLGSKFIPYSYNQSEGCLKKHPFRKLLDDEADENDQLEQFYSLNTPLERLRFAATMIIICPIVQFSLIRQIFLNSR